MFWTTWDLGIDRFALLIYDGRDVTLLWKEFRFFGGED